jgi:hypothetical protein
MAATERCDALRVRSRLQFSQPSQGSQPTPSHALSTALGACRLNASQQACAADDVVMSQRSLDPASAPSQLSASQDTGLGCAPASSVSRAPHCVLSDQQACRGAARGLRTVLTHMSSACAASVVPRAQQARAV